MKKLPSHITFLILLSWSGIAFAQSPKVQFVQADPYVSGLQNLWLITIEAKSGAQVAFNLTIHQNGRTFYTAQTVTMELRGPQTVLNLGKTSLQSEMYTDATQGQYVKALGLLPQGNYSACVELIGQKTLTTITCTEFVVPEKLQVNQIYPPDQFQLSPEIKQPIFSWMLTTPTKPTMGATYTFFLFEMAEGQSAHDAALRNVPIHVTRELQSNTYNYPIDAISLKQDGKYAWMVEVNVGSQVIASSSVWKFTFKPDEPKKVTVAQQVYIDLNKDEHLTEVLTNGSLNLAYRHDQNQHQELSFEFFDSKGNSLKSKVKPVEIIYGENYFSVDLSQVKGLRKNQVYIVTIKGLKKPIQLVFRHIKS